MHHLFLAPTTPDTPAAALLEDTYDETEAQALRQVVAETHLGGDPLPTVQAAVVHARMVHQQNWTCEARQLLAELGLTPAAVPLMRLA